ncbi:MAG: gamma-glutamyltransferase family protein [Deltaproteobacteria bacterium]|nr:gamma-glutamyltransferase family protein [Candidatus Zymogenaceae bacterium]
MKVLKTILLSFLGVVAVIVIVYLLLPKGPGELMKIDDPYHIARKSVIAKEYMASTGSPWATDAALSIMEAGGNAFDAGMAALLVLNVTIPEAASFPCVAPTMIYDARTNDVLSYCGVGKAPGKATIEFFRDKGYKSMPKLTILSQLVPASPDVLIAVLDRYGTKSFAEVSAPAIKLAREGFPVHSMMLNHLDLNPVERFGFFVKMPYNVEVYLGGRWWKPLHHGERFKEPDLAGTLESLAAAEKKALDGGATRSEALKAVRDYFYRGPLADAILKLHEEKGGLFSREDLSEYSGYWEKPVTGYYRGYAVHTNGPWNQGAVLPMALMILDGIDLKSMGHNSPEYVHTVLQAIELAMADREAYFGDPAFVDVPIAGLMDERYAALRRTLMTPGKAFGAMPPAGDPANLKAIREGGESAGRTLPSSEDSVNADIDTTYLAVTDRWGNSISLTPSDFPQSPMVPGTGMCLGVRMTQFRLDPDHPDALMPGKRPRITPNSPLVTKDGRLFMTFGSPEGDQQPQALIQVFLNLIVFGMDIQDAIEAPRFRSKNFPDSFSPHEYKPGTVEMEQSLYDRVGNDLEKMGYKTEVTDDWSWTMGAIGAIISDAQTHTLVGGADPRQENWAAGK